jgi:hypothetical protein
LSEFIGWPFAAMFSKVDNSLGEKIKEIAKGKIEGNHNHPHKTARH